MPLPQWGWEGFGGWLHLSGNSAGDLQVELPVLGLPILDLPILFFFFFFHRNAGFGEDSLMNHRSGGSWDV